MLDYYHYTKDPSYNDVVLQALLAKVNLGPNNDYMPPEHADEEGNDDLFFWGHAVLTAAERNFPQPNSNLPSWLDISINVFDQLASRWYTEDCNGGIFWQILETNPNGQTYKNSISNGGFFQLAARLYRITGEQSYLDWANTAWDWMWDHDLIDHDRYRIYDGIGIGNSCTDINYASFTYLSGIILYGATVLHNYTGQAEWTDRSSKLLDGASWFFMDDGIMYEGACEEAETCFNGNADMSTFKGFLARFMWQSAIMMPSLHSQVASWLIPSADAAGDSCSGGESNTKCGMRWYEHSFDGKTGLGPQMCALEAIQGLLADSAAPPLSGDEIRRVSNAQFDAVNPYRADAGMPSEEPEPEPEPEPTPTSTPPPPPPPSTSSEEETTSTSVATSSSSSSTSSSPSSSSSSAKPTMVTPSSSTTPTPTPTPTTSSTTSTSSSSTPTPTISSSSSTSETPTTLSTSTPSTTSEPPTTTSSSTTSDMPTSTRETEPETTESTLQTPRHSSDCTRGDATASAPASVTASTPASHSKSSAIFTESTQISSKTMTTMIPPPHVSSHFPQHNATSSLFCPGSMWKPPTLTSCHPGSPQVTSDPDDESLAGLVSSNILVVMLVALGTALATW